MTVADWAGVVAGVTGLLAAGVAWRAAVNAKNLAKKGNSLAEAANQTAADALGEAKEANSIAEDANQLAGDANRIAERALRAAQDDVPYNWVLKVEDDGSAVVINDCGHGAAQVTVVIDCAGEVVGESGPTDIAKFGEVAFDVKSAIEKHFEHVRQHPYSPSRSGGGVFIAGSSGKVTSTIFRAHVRWLTEQEVPRTDVVQEVVSHLMTHEGMRRHRRRLEPGS